MNVEKVFNKPKLIGVCGDSNSGKSNLIYNFIKELNENYEFNLYTYKLKADVGTKIHSIEELELIRNSIIMIDEFFSLFDLDDRHNKRIIENTLRLIFHNNNILLLAGLPENFKKFISNKLDEIFFMKSTIGDFINGSRIKKVCLNYRGDELGSSVLNLPKNKCLYYNGLRYNKLDIPYLPEFDTKKKNVDIIVNKNVGKFCGKILCENVGKNVIKRKSIFKPKHLNSLSSLL